MKSKEEQRLKELYSYDILDTESEPEYDAITELAAHLFDAPISYVGLVDDNRQWYKSKIGLEANELPRKDVICNEALQNDGVLHIPDLSKDSRFKNHPLVKADPKLRFYAGAPLKTPSGHNIGTVCVVDTKEKKLSDFQIKALSILSDQVMAHLELRRKNLMLQKYAEDLKHQQDSLVQTEKLASLGRMAGGIAHELNNPLQIINSYLELINVRARKTEHKEEFAEIVKNAKNTVFRMARIIQTMLGFVKSGRNESVEEAQLLSLVDDSLALLAEKLGNFEGEFETKWQVDNQLVLSCNPVEITQVLINLISNAVYAARQSEKPQVKLEVREQGEDLFFDIYDNGPGVPEEIIGQVKEPFFTTKKVGEGTGLGLYISHQVADRAGGSIEYDRQDPWTLFSLRIPFKKPEA